MMKLEDATLTTSFNKEEGRGELEAKLSDFGRIGFERTRLRMLSVTILRQNQIKARVGKWQPADRFEDLKGVRTGPTPKKKWRVVCLGSWVWVNVTKSEHPRWCRSGGGGHNTPAQSKDSMNLILEVIWLSETLQGGAYMNPPPRTILDKSHLRHHSGKIRTRTRCHHALPEALALC